MLQMGLFVQLRMAIKNCKLERRLEGLRKVMWCVVSLYFLDKKWLGSATVSPAALALAFANGPRRVLATVAPRAVKWFFLIMSSTVAPCKPLQE